MIINHIFNFECYQEVLDTDGLEIMRTRANMTQAELAAKLGIDRTCIAKWETGKAYPRASQLPVLAKALNCTIDELYSAVAGGTH